MKYSLLPGPQVPAWLNNSDIYTPGLWSHLYSLALFAAGLLFHAV